MKTKDLIDEKWGAEKLPIGGVVPEGGTSLLFKTGEWRVYLPVLEDVKCTGCTKCYFICPDDAIRLTAEYHPEFLMDYCKGCSLCKEICPTAAIEMILEEK